MVLSTRSSLSDIITSERIRPIPIITSAAASTHNSTLAARSSTSTEAGFRRDSLNTANAAIITSPSNPRAEGASNTPKGMKRSEQDAPSDGRKLVVRLRFVSSFSFSVFISFQ
jgi:hypothetical protein